MAKLKNLDDLARDYCAAEVEKETLQEKRKYLFAQILEAEDDQKPVERLRAELTQIDQQNELLQNRIASTKNRMESVASAEIESQLAGLPGERVAMNKSVMEAEQALAQHIASSIKYAGCLGFNLAVGQLKSIFKEAHGAFEPIPEHARMRELIDKATDSAPKPPNIHQIRVDVRLLEGLKSDPSLMKNRVDWLVKRAVAQARSRS